MTTEPTEEQIRLILIESYERDRALQDARHREELAAYELTVSNLREAQGRDKHWHDTAWNRGHQMGMAANRDIARQVTEALAKEREAHAETNRMTTEALMQAEAAQGVPEGWVLVPVEPHAEQIMADMHAAAMGEITGPVLGVVEDVAALRVDAARYLYICKQDFKDRQWFGSFDDYKRQRDACIDVSMRAAAEIGKAMK